PCWSARVSRYTLSTGSRVGSKASRRANGASIEDAGDSEMVAMMIPSLRRNAVYNSTYGGNAVSPSVGRREVAPQRRGLHRMLAAGEDGGAFPNEIVGRARGQRLDGQAGVGRTLRGQDAAVANKKIGNVVGASESIHHGRARVAAHACGADEVGKAVFLHHLGGPRGAHDLHHLAFAELNQLL